MLKLIKKLVLLFFMSFLTTFSYSHAVIYQPKESIVHYQEEKHLPDKPDDEWVRKNFSLDQEHATLPDKFHTDKLRRSLEAMPRPRLGPKVAYLTFDDGPSANTLKVLSVLKSYAIKATFFVNGRSEKQYEDTYRQIIREGHKLGNHTFSHNYAVVYSSVDNFMRDYDKLNNYLVDITGTAPDILRFPGGSNNQVSWSYSGRGFMKQQLIPAVLNKGYMYFDWNVSCGDADGGLPSKEKLLNNVKNTLSGQSDAVVLFHDSYGAVNTPLALPSIIDYIKSKGYFFDVLNRDTPACRFK